MIASVAAVPMSAPPKRPAARASLRLAALRVVVDHFDLRRVVGEREMLRELAVDVDRAQASREQVYELAKVLREVMVHGTDFRIRMQQEEETAVSVFESDIASIPALRRLGHWVTICLADTDKTCPHCIINVWPTKPAAWEQIVDLPVSTPPADWRSAIITRVLGDVGPAPRETGSHYYLFPPKTPEEPRRVDMTSQTEFAYFAFVRRALACEDEIAVLRPRCDAFIVLRDLSIREYYLHCIAAVQREHDQYYGDAGGDPLACVDVHDNFEMTYEDRLLVVPLLRHVGLAVSIWHPEDVGDGVTLSVNLGWDEAAHDEEFSSHYTDEEGWTLAETSDARFKVFPPLANVLN